MDAGIRIVGGSILLCSIMLKSSYIFNNMIKNKAISLKEFIGCFDVNLVLTYFLNT